MPQTQLTAILKACEGRGDDSFDRAVAMVYEDLRRIARGQLRRAGGRRVMHTTVLVNEAYLKLVKADPNWNDSEHFFAIAARAMRQILIDTARAERRKKRGGDEAPVTLEEDAAVIDLEVEQALAIDAALKRLSSEAPRRVQVVECRYYAGLSEAETASALGMSLRSVQREWRRAREWLKETLRDPAPSQTS